MAQQAFEFSGLKDSRPKRSAVLLLAVLAGCASSPDDEGGDDSSDTDRETGGVIDATGGGAVEGSGGVATGGTGAGTGGAGASDSDGGSAGGGAANAGGAFASGGATSSGGAEATGGTEATGGAEASGGETSTGGADGGCSDAGEVSFVASFDDSVNESYRAGISSCIEVAGSLWNELLTVPFDVTLEVLVAYDSSISTANGRSTTTVEWDGANNIYEVSAAYEIRTGEDPNGASADIEINFGTSLTNATYWFDPDPSARTAAIPSGKIDVLSTCAHELGHGIAFSGARSSSTGELPGYSFLYDEYSTAIGEYFYFTGALAQAAYGAEVPQNEQILDHLGNVEPGPGFDLDLDLMHGTPTRYQQRYYPTDVDAGILADLGLPVTGTPAGDAVCSAPRVRAKTSGSPKLGPAPSFVE